MVVTTVRDALNYWSWLIDVNGIQVSYTSCIGDVIFEDLHGKTMILDVTAGELREFDVKEQDWIANQGTLVSKLEKEGLVLGEGQCYGMKPTAVFKSFEAQHMYVATMPEYISFMGSFFEQIKDLPDGTTVRLKVK